MGKYLLRQGPAHRASLTSLRLITTYRTLGAALWENCLRKLRVSSDVVLYEWMNEAFAALRNVAETDAKDTTTANT